MRFVAVLRPGWPAFAKENLRWREFGGAFGDMGTFLPMITLLATQNHLPFALMLFFAGIANLIVAVLYDVPIPVQPMHAISAIAISENLEANEVLAAGICVGAVVAALGITGLIHTVNKLIPLPVVRGLQLGLGIKLVIKAHKMLVPLDPVGWDSHLVAALAGAFILITTNDKRLPGALLLFLFGIGIAVGTHAEARHLKFGIGHFEVAHLTAENFKHGFIKAAIPQIPLTTMNSVIALVKLNDDLFPTRKTSLVKVTASIGLIDLTLPWLGGIPSCHGAGGLAAQYAFGARSNVSMFLLAGVKILGALVFGDSLLSLVTVYPRSVLASMLAYSGLQLGACARDIRDVDGAMAMVLTAGAALGFDNTAIGVATGLAGFVCLKLLSWRHEGPRIPAFLRSLLPRWTATDAPDGYAPIPSHDPNAGPTSGCDGTMNRSHCASYLGFSALGVVADDEETVGYNSNSIQAVKVKLSSNESGASLFQPRRLGLESPATPTSSDNEDKPRPMRGISNASSIVSPVPSDNGVAGSRIVSRDTLPPANSVPALGRNVSTRSEPRFAPETAFARAAEFISTDGSESMATQEAELISTGSVGDGTIDSSTEDRAIS